MKQNILGENTPFIR